MPHFVIICHDKPNSLDLRMATRPAHLEYVNSFSSARKVAGPILDKDGKPKGSAFVMELADIDDANNFVKNDPYSKAGLFEAHLIELFNPLMGEWTE